MKTITSEIDCIFFMNETKEIYLQERMFQHFPRSDPLIRIIPQTGRQE